MVNTLLNMNPVKISKNEISSPITKSNDFYVSGDNMNGESKLSKNKKETTQNEGICIAWKDLRVTADIKKHHIFRSTTHNYKEIIRDVDGYVESSSLVAILGASGSGKSTFMSALANRQPGDLKVSGDIRINGRKLQMKLMREISGFVYQDELFFSALTVLEHLNFVAQLKLDKKLTKKCRRKLIDKLIRDIGLTKCAKNLIGNTYYGGEKITLSGGERKRLSVATELLTDPPLLFCDEPTTGLDSFTSLRLMTDMKNMVDQRATTIICSVHQPNEQIFNLFHQIILLYKGRIAFSGTTEEALTFFQSIGCHYSEEQNPANYLIECIAVVPEQQSESSKRASDICTKFQNSQYAKIIQDRIETERHKNNQDNGFIKTKERISWFYMLYLMIHRQILVDVIRDAATQRMDVIRKMAMATAMGICMMGINPFTQSGIQLLKGVFLYILADNCFNTVFVILGRFPYKMPIFFREYPNNVNTPLLFYLSNFISMIPLLMTCSVVNVTLLYILVGLRKSWIAFLWSLMSITLLTFTSAALGILLSISTNSVDTANNIFYPVRMLWLIYIGIYINLRSIPRALSWIRYVSWMTYAMEILLAVQLEGVDHIECSAVTTTPCLRTGEEVLRSMDFDANNLTRNLIMICILFFVFLILGYFALRIKLYFKIK